MPSALPTLCVDSADGRSARLSGAVAGEESRVTLSFVLSGLVADVGHDRLVMVLRVERAEPAGDTVDTPRGERVLVARARRDRFAVRGFDGVVLDLICRRDDRLILGQVHRVVDADWRRVTGSGAERDQQVLSCR